MKKLLVLTGAIAIALVSASLFAAFEAHVVNVTATIENALSVPVDSINFGTVFPQEQLDQHVNVGLSQSFLDPTQTRVDTVSYMIRQKPKCGITSQNGTVLDKASPMLSKTGHIVVGDNPQTPEIETYWVDCGESPRTLNDGESWGVLPSLCPYLSKHSSNTGDENIPAFHVPFTINPDGQITWTEAHGTLSKSNQATADWTIDLKVPCFGGQCAQDWASFVHGINPNADPAQFTQPIANEHRVFGCDLWFETTGVCAQVPTTVSVVSDTSNTVQGGGNAVALSFIHPAWTATPLIPGATWIWATDPVSEPTTVDNTQTFDKQFTVTQPVISASIKIATDNFYILKINGVIIGQELTDENNFQAATYDTYAVNNLIVGTNTVEIIGTNKGLAGSTPASNPAGVLYNLTYNVASSCVNNQ